MRHLKRKDLLKFESVKNWFDSLESNAKMQGRKGLSKSVKSMRLGRLWELTNKGEISPDELLEEAKEDIEKTGKRLEDYFTAKSEVTSHNTAVTCIGYLRGFYSHNNITFPKKIRMPSKVEAPITNHDAKVSFYDFDEETKEFVFKNDKIRHFIQHLPFRDQVIALCLLSSGADTRDLLNLNVGFVKDAKGRMCDKKRFFWSGNRLKTRQPFRTFFSAEATKYLKRYVEQERANAKDNEPLFVGTEREYTISKGEHKGKHVEINQRVTTNAVSMSFRTAAQTMGYAKKKGEPNPFRPKRFRHLFRTACAIAEIDNGYVKAMMGHTDMTTLYVEKDIPLFKKVYLKAEPFLTVFPGVNNETRMEIKDMREDIVTQARETTKLKKEVTDLKEQLKQAVKQIYSFEPLLDTFSAIADTKEGQELIQKIKEAKLKQEYSEARKDDEEITKSNPIPKKTKSE